MREGETQPDELHVLAGQFEQRMAELKQHATLRLAERLGLRFEEMDDFFAGLEVAVDQQLISQRGSVAKIREAIKLVDEAIAEIGLARQTGRWPWPDSADFSEWLRRVEALAK